jgi:hypothetical protein
VNTEVFQVNTEVSQLKYGPAHTSDSSGILKYSHPSGCKWRQQRWRVGQQLDQNRIFDLRGGVGSVVLKGFLSTHFMVRFKVEVQDSSSRFWLLLVNISK